MKQNLFIILFYSLAFYTGAQDIHFSQYYASHENLNPALTGFFHGTQRYTFQNKTQWRSVTTPFRTISASLDMPVLQRYLRQDLFGGGIVINRDQAGDSKFGTTQANISLSYIRSINKINNQYLSCGVQLGAAQRTIDYSKLVFDSQYDGTSFNSALPNNEHFNKSNFIFFDISAGAYWYYILNHGRYFDGGIALFHINKPAQSLFSNYDVRLNRKLVIHGGSQFEVSKKMSFLPGFLFMQQGTYNEINLGMLFKFANEPSDKNYVSFKFGTYYRFKDAMNFIASLDYNEYTLGISYDINTSDLMPASNSKGGFEISLIYIYNKTKKAYVKKISCPIF